MRLRIKNKIKDTVNMSKRARDVFECMRKTHSVIVAAGSSPECKHTIRIILLFCLR